MDSAPKDLMILLYIPAITVILLGSLITLIAKRGGHPYVLPAMLVLLLPTLAPVAYLVPLVWYLYDRFSKRQIDQSQTTLLLGVGVVLAIYAVSGTPLIPDQNQAVTAMAVLATLAAIICFILAIIQRKR